jgi:hypothetical protein
MDVYLIPAIVSFILSLWLFQRAGESIGLVFLVLIGYLDHTVGNVVFPGIILYSAIRQWLFRWSYV